MEAEKLQGGGGLGAPRRRGGTRRALCRWEPGVLGWLNGPGRGSDSPRCEGSALRRCRRRPSHSGEAAGRGRGRGRAARRGPWERGAAWDIPSQPREKVGRGESGSSLSRWGWGGGTGPPRGSVYFLAFAGTRHPPSHPCHGTEMEDWGPGHHRRRALNSLCVPGPEGGPLESEAAPGLTRAAKPPDPAPGSRRSGEGPAAAPGRWRTGRGDLQGRGAGVAGTSRRRWLEQGPKWRGRRGHAARAPPGSGWRCPWCCHLRAQAPGGSAGRRRRPLRAPEAG